MEVKGANLPLHNGYLADVNKKWFIAPLALTAACLLAKPVHRYSWAIGPVGGALINKLAHQTFFSSWMQATDFQKMDAAEKMAEAIDADRATDGHDSLETSEKLRSIMRRLGEPCCVGELEALVDEFKGIAGDIAYLTFVELTDLGHEAQDTLAAAITQHGPRHLTTDDVDLCAMTESRFLTIDAREMKEIPKLDDAHEVVILIVKEEELLQKATEAKNAFPNANKLLVTCVNEGRYGRTFVPMSDQSEPLLETHLVPDYTYEYREVMVYGPGGESEPYVYDAEGLKKMVGHTIESDSVHMREHINRLSRL